MRLEVIKEDVFESLTHPTIFRNIKTDRCYAVVADNHTSFKIAWSSDLMKPSTILIKPDVYSIGIDEHFAIVDFRLKEIVLNTTLAFTFHEVQLSSNLIIVATELEIILIDIKDYNVHNRVTLPDIYDSMNLIGSELQVTCMDGHVTQIQIA